MADAGRILIIPKGTYDASVSYEMLDMVKHNDIVWLAKKAVTGIEPSNANSEYWFLMAETNTSSFGGKTAEEWQAEIDNIVDGTTPVASANSVPWSGISNKPSTFAPTTHSHTKSQITDFPTTMTPTAHNQSASTVTAGTLGGAVVANATAVATLGTKQVRNIYAGTAELTAGSSALPSGDIYFQYKS